MLNGYEANGKIFKVHLDGDDQHDLLSGGDDKRREFFHWIDEHDLAASATIRGVVVLEQQHEAFASKGQVALVVGASTGIGLVIIGVEGPRLSESEGGAERNGKALTGAVKAHKDAGHQGIGIGCDVSDETQAAAMVERSGTFGRLDMAYNNAGILGLMGPMMEETAAGLDEVQRRQPARRMDSHEA